MQNETSFPKQAFFFCDRMRTAISCCLLFVQDRDLLSNRNIVVWEPVRDIQQRRLLGNIEDSRVSRIAAVSI